MAELCHRCQSFDIQALADTGFAWKGFRTTDVQTSAQAGCLFCSYLVKALPGGFEIPSGKLARMLGFGPSGWINFRAVRADHEWARNLTSEGLPLLQTGDSGLNIINLVVGAASKDRPFEGQTLMFHAVADNGKK